MRFDALALGVGIQSMGTDRFVTVTTNASPPRWSIRQWTTDLSDAPAAPVVRELRCSATSPRFELRGSDAWVLSNPRDPAECVGRRRYLRVDLVDLRSGRDVFAPYEIDISFGAATPDAGANGVAFDPYLSAVDAEDGVAVVATRYIGDGPSAAVETFLLRLYRDGTWGARKVADAAVVQWMLPQPDGGWLVSLSRVDSSTMDNVSELLRLDANGRRQAPPIAYSRGHLVNDVGYGLEPSGRGVWIVDVARTPADAEHAFLRLRRIALAPATR